MEIPMTTRSLLLVTLVAACSKSSSPPPAATGSGSGSAPAPAVSAVAPAPAPAPAATTAPACPAADALTAKLAELWKTTPDAIANASCVAGKFPAPGWYISGYVSLADKTVERSSIVDAKGTV